MRTNTNVAYKDVPNGAIFQAKSGETHRGKFVPNTGTFKKEGNSHAVEIHTKQEAIFSPYLPCRVIKEKV